MADAQDRACLGGEKDASTRGIYLPGSHHLRGAPGLRQGARTRRPRADGRHRAVVSTPTGTGAGRRNRDGVEPEIELTGTGNAPTKMSVHLSVRTDKIQPVVKMKKPAFRCPFRPPRNRASAVLPPDHTPTTTLNMWLGVVLWSGGRRVFWAAKSMGRKVVVWKRIRN